MNLRIARLVVLLHASVDAAATADAARDIERISELYARHGGGIRNVDVLAVLVAVTQLQIGDKGFQPILGGFEEALGAARGQDPGSRGGGRGNREQAPRGVGTSVGVSRHRLFARHGWFLNTNAKYRGLAGVG